MAVSRHIGESQDFLYLAKHTTKTIDKDGVLLESVYYEGPYSTIGPARTRKSIAQRGINEDKANNRIGPHSKPSYNGKVWLDKTAEVVRIPFKPEPV